VSCETTAWEGPTRLTEVRILLLLLPLYLQGLVTFQLWKLDWFDVICSKEICFLSLPYPPGLNKVCSISYSGIPVDVEVKVTTPQSLEVFFPAPSLHHFKGRVYDNLSHNFLNSHVFVHTCLLPLLGGL